MRAALPPDPKGLPRLTGPIGCAAASVSLGPGAAAQVDAAITAQNPEVVWMHSSTRGYVRLVLQRDRAQVTYVGVDTVASRDFLPRGVREVTIVRDADGIRYA